MLAFRVASLALRELWISYRLLLLLAASVAGGIAAAVLPGNADAWLTALGWGAAAAGLFAAAMGAFMAATERRAGRTAWLALRGVPRSAIVVGWWLALSTPIAGGIAASGVIAWTGRPASSPVGPDLDPGAFTVLVAVGAAASMAAAGLGVVLGGLLGPRTATIVAVLAGAMLLLPGLLLHAAGVALPPVMGAGLLAAAGDLGRPLSDGLEGLGVSLAVAGAILGGAAALYSRIDL